MPVASGYSAGKFAIEIDGSFAGFIESVEGGEPFGVVAEEAPSPSGLIKKHLSSVRFEPIKLTASNGLSSFFYSWIAEMLARAQSPRDGAIVFYDFQLNEINRLEFTNGLITEVVFPRLDGSSREAATFSLTITPEATTFKPSAGKTKAKLSSKKQKKVLASNFKFTLDGLENASKRVRSIDSITIKESERDPQDRLAQPPLNVSNVVVTLPMVDAEPWFDFLDDFVVQTNNADSFERQGSIELLDPSLKDVQFTLDLQNVGIVRARRVRADSGSEVVATMEVELYCESVVFTPSSDALGQRCACGRHDCGASLNIQRSRAGAARDRNAAEPAARARRRRGAAQPGKCAARRFGGDCKSRGAREAGGGAPAVYQRRAGRESESETRRRYCPR